MVFNKNEKTSEFIQDWINIYKEFKEQNLTRKDQPSFRKALYNSTLRFYILPPEYNLRTFFAYFAGSMPVKIIHGRGIPMERAKRNINKNLNPRAGNLNYSYFLNKIYELIYRYF